MAKANRVLPEALDSLRRAAAANVQAFDAQGLAHTLWTSAKTSWVLPEICDAVCRAAAGNGQAFNALGLASTLWAMATTSQVLPESFDPPHEYISSRGVSSGRTINGHHVRLLRPDHHFAADCHPVRILWQGLPCHP